MTAAKTWVVTVAVPPAHKCLRCGAEEPIRMPLPVSKFLAQAKAFMKRHGRCEWAR